MKKLDYLIIGAQKGGTTSAINHFNQHPDIFLFPSELHFFDEENKFNLGYDHYHSFFVKKQNKIIGEKTPAYSYQRYCIDRIYDYNPDIKLIYFLRNPVTRAFSEWNMYKNTSRIDVDFITSINREKDIDLSDIKNTNYHAFQRGIYIEHINYILTKFKKENLYLAISERVMINPQEEYNKMFNFLGARNLNKLKFDESVHKGHYRKKISQEEYDYLYDLYKPYNEKLFEFLGETIPEWIK